MIEFINAYGMKIVFVIVMTIFGGIGLLLGRFLNTETKQIIAKNAMLFVEQTIHDLHGEDKMLKALDTAAQLLTKKGIKFKAEEMRILIEAALGEFNKALNKATSVEVVK